MRFRSRSAAALAVLAACMMSGCEVDKQAQPWPSPSEKDIGLADIPLQSGFYHGRVYHYWDAGVATPAVSNVYVLYRSGSGSQIPESEQYPIVDAVTGSPNYSPFRQVIKVTVPSSYVGNTMTSVTDLANALYLDQAVPTYLAWDAPSVLKDATLGGSTAAPIPVWFDGQVAYVFKLGNNIPVDRNLGMVPIAPLYEISRGGTVLQGNSIFALKQGDPGYSPLCQETEASVNDSYPAEGTPRWQSSIAVDLNLGGYLIERTQTDTLYNYAYQSIGDYSLEDSDLGYVDDSDPDLYPTGPPPVRLAWYNGTMYTYSDLGVTDFDASDVWQLFRADGAPIDGQDPIVVAAPGDSGYSAIRHLHRIYLDAGAAYTPNSIKSYETLLQTGAEDQDLEEGWDAPVVNRDARWGGQPPLMAWVNGKRLPYYLLVEDNLSILDGRVSVMQSYDVYRQQDPSDTMGVWLEDNSLIPAVPGQDSYSPVRSITHILVNPSYPDTLYKSIADAAADLIYRVSGILTVEPNPVNRPVNP